MSVMLHRTEYTSLFCFYRVSLKQYAFLFLNTFRKLIWSKTPPCCTEKWKTMRRSSPAARSDRATTNIANKIS